MFILVFLALGLVVWGLVLAFFKPMRQHLRRYTILSFVFVNTGLALFTLLSWALGLVRFGVPYSLSIPDDYLALGAVGIFALLVGIIGVCSPILAAWFVARQTPIVNAA